MNCPVPDAWQLVHWVFLGAAGFGPVPGPVTLWQMPHAAVRFAEVRWEIEAVEIARTPCQSVGCASAVVWQVVHTVVAPVPPPNDLGDVPWHAWQ